MDEKKTQQIGDKIKSFVAKIPKTVKRLAIAVAVIVVVAIAAVAIINAAKPYSVLFTGLSSDDMSSILTYLDEQGVTDYKVENGDTILVPDSKEAALKASLLMEGYPSSGFAYSMYLENVGTLSTESDRKTLYLFDLQDRLSAVVRCFDGVKDATVTIAQGENSSYVLNRDKTIEATAAVLVTMKGTQKLTDQQAKAIRNLVGSAVQGLVIDNVSIADTAGNTYSVDNSASGTASLSSGSQLKLELEGQVNEKVRTNILQVLIPLFGAQNISVSVNSTVDISTTYVDATTYTEPEWAADGSTGGEGIIGSKVYDNSVIKDGETAAGAVGTETNSDVSTYAENYTPDGTESQISSSGEIDYNVNTTHTQTESPAGVVTDIMIAVSINDKVQQVNTDALRTHIARAAGISADMEQDKISIMTAAFHQEETTEPTIEETTGLPSWVFTALIAGAGLFLVLLVLILILRGKRKKKRKSQPTPAAVFAGGIAEPPDTGADIMDIHAEKSMELRRDVRQFAESNPEIAAQMVKTWLKGDDERG